MVDRCANPDCRKPLHYLREGAIYLFEGPAKGPEDPNNHQIEHYWLCGECSATYLLERPPGGEIQLVRKEFRGFVRRRAPVGTAEQVLSLGVHHTE
jgi:hypothetical protein